jgi:hypothetical protein
MFEPKPITIENDYLHNGVTNPHDANFRWNGPSLSLERPDAAANIKDRQARAKALEDKQRAALDAAEKAKGSPLSFDERMFAMRVK